MRETCEEPILTTNVKEILEKSSHKICKLRGHMLNLEDTKKDLLDGTKPKTGIKSKGEIKAEFYIR